MDSIYSQKSSDDLMTLKLERKKLETDAKLLENRIRLLEVEDRKAQKKIEETVKKTEKLKEIRQRNERSQQEHRKLKYEEISKINELTFQNKMLKKKSQTKIVMNRSFCIDRNKQDAIEVKTLKKNLKNRAKKDNEIETMRNIEITQRIRNEDRIKTLKRQKIMDLKLKSMHEEHENKQKFEILQKIKKQAEIAKLELKELELIKKLQLTQNKENQLKTDFKKYKAC